MRQAWRGLALLAVGALTMGGSVALAHDGGGHGNGNGNGALAPTIFTMPGADGNPEGVAFDKKSGRFFVSRTGTGAIFSGTLDNTTLQPFIAGAEPAARRERELRRWHDHDAVHRHRHRPQRRPRRRAWRAWRARRRR